MRDKAWVRQILKGNKLAGERFVTVNYPRIFRLLRYLTGNVETAEDLTQQTFAKAWKALPNYKGDALLSTWLHRIAYHEYTHWLRDRREHAPLEDALQVADLRAVQGLDTILLPRALSHLSAELRETFLLYYVQELSVPEVAAILELPPGTIKSRLFTARQRLREILQEAEPAYGLPQTVSAPRLSIAKEIIPNELSVSQKREAH